MNNLHNAGHVFVNGLQHGRRRPGNIDEGQQEVHARDLRARHIPSRTLPVGRVTAHPGLPPLDVALREVPARTVLAAQRRKQVLFLAAEREQVAVPTPDGIGWCGQTFAKPCLTLPLEDAELQDAAGRVGHAVVHRSEIPLVRCNVIEFVRERASSVRIE